MTDIEKAIKHCKKVSDRDKINRIITYAIGFTISIFIPRAFIIL